MHDIISDPEKREIRHQRRERREKLALEEDDPDAVVNLGEDNSGWLEEDERSDEDLSSDSASEGSLQPYDMSDDESELEKRKLPSQLRDCISNLQKPDDSDAVCVLVLKQFQEYLGLILLVITL